MVPARGVYVEPWTIRDKRVLITGATSGIGFEAAAALARMGARVAIVGRDPERTRAASEAIAQKAGVSAVDTFVCEMGSQAAVRGLAEEVRARFERLDVLVNNAGGVNAERVTTVDGIEQTFAVNHLAPFLLTLLLRDLLVASAPARVVVVSSRGHARGTMDLDDPGFARGGYQIMRAYCRSKLANVLFANELARRLEGTGVTANSLHPGGVATNIWSKAPWWIRPALEAVTPLVLWTPEQGGETIVKLATDPELSTVTGAYFHEFRRREPAPLARDPELARALWERSAELVGLPTG